MSGSVVSESAMVEAVNEQREESAPVVEQTEQSEQSQQSESVEANEVESEAEVKPKLVLAPLPKKSPWEETGSAEIKPLDLSKVVAAKNKKATSMGKSRSKGTPSLTGKEKWIPLDVDIVVKDKIPDVNANGNGNVNGASNGKGKKLKNKAKKDKPKNAKKGKGKESGKAKSSDAEGEKKSAKKSERPSSKNAVTDTRETSAPAEKTKENEKDADENESKNVDSTTEADASSDANPEGAEKAKNGASAKKGDRPHRRFTANSKPFFPRNQNYHNHHNHHNHHHSHPHQHMNHTNNHNHHHGAKSHRARQYVPVMYQQQNYTPSYVLVNELVRQIQYYFSIENLSKDNFLKSQMNAQGYVPLALISRFHRMLNLSYGDVGLILAALRELKNSTESNVNIAKLTSPFEDVQGNPLFQYALSSKVWTIDSESLQNAKSYETVELVGDELELFKIEPINPIIDSPKQQEQQEQPIAQDAQETTQD